MYSSYSSRRSMVNSPYSGLSGPTGLPPTPPVPKGPGYSPVNVSNGYNRYRDYSDSRYAEVTTYATPLNYSFRSLRRGNSLEPNPSSPMAPCPSYNSSSLSRGSSTSRNPSSEHITASSTSRTPSSDLLSDYLAASARGLTAREQATPSRDKANVKANGLRESVKRQHTLDSRTDRDPRDHTRYLTPSLTPREKLENFRAQPFREKRPISCDKVYNGIIISNGEAVLDIAHLKSLGVTHVLNTAEHHVEVSPGAYSLNNIQYYGFHVDDLPQANISRFFRRTTDFIHRAVESGGLVVVNCYMGLSRSATCVIAYLMMKRNMTCKKALEVISQSRKVRPNPGFLQQLSELEHTLRLSGRFSSTR